jgi:drug/metabolite transporter (DMT)-like permease
MSASAGPGKTSLDLVAVIAMIVLCASWGGQQVAIKVANSEIPPVLQSGLRSAGATLLLALYMTWRGIPMWNRDRSLWPGLAAGVLFAVEFMLLYWGLSYTSAGRAVVFLYVAPFVVALGAHWCVPGERIGALQLVGLGCAFTGLFVAFGGGASSPQAAVGDLMALAAGILWGATTVLIKAGRLARASPHKILLYQLVLSGAALPLASLLLGEPSATVASPLVAGSLAYQTVWVAFLTYLAWFTLVRTYPAALLSSFTFLSPVFGTLAGHVILDEPLTPRVFLTLALISGGILLVNYPATRRRPG